MINRRIGFLVLVLCWSPSIFGQSTAPIYKKGWIDFNKNGKKDRYEDPAATIPDRINDLLRQMTLEEKTNQLATLYGYRRVLQDELPTDSWKAKIWKDGIANIDEHLNSLPFHPQAKSAYSYPFSKHKMALETVQRWFVEQTRLGIPVDFSNEGIHGLNHEKATPFPSPINMGSTWNKELIGQVGHTIGREARLLGYTNVYAPILDLARDPRWGRVMETFGEDPYLVAELGKALTVGIQAEGVVSTLKHFAAYSVPKGGRDGFARTDPHIAPRELHEMHLYPFRRVIQEAHPLGVMSSYNDWDGMPVTGSGYFLTDLLRTQYGFKGYVVSDSEAVEYLYTKHQVANSPEDAVRLAVEAGLNVRTNFTPPEDYILPLRRLVQEGKVRMETLDSRVYDVLYVKFKLGLFDDPFKLSGDDPDKGVHRPADDSLALQVHRESIVLLKNDSPAGADRPVLPLSPHVAQKILVTGPMAKATRFMESRYGPSGNPISSIYDGLVQGGGPQIDFSYALGCAIVNDTWPESEIIPTPLTAEEERLMDDAVAQAKQVDVIIAVMGEDEKRVGESLSRTSLDLPGRQRILLQRLQALNKPIVLILTAGQPLTINWEDRYIPSILCTWFPGAWGGQAVADVVFGRYNPSGRLSVTFPKSIGQIEWNFPFKKGSHNGQPGDGPNGYGNTAVVGSLYPFGHGLSYAEFAYSNLRIDRETLTADDTVAVSVDVTNRSKRYGEEVVQLYVTDEFSSLTTYESLLRGFEKVAVAGGQTKTVTFRLPIRQLEMLNKEMEWEVEPGSFLLKIGHSSEDIRLEKRIAVVPERAED
ncbi:beta-glucosidase [Sphingobacterium sp. SGG-5]|nr:beta-glucosidase [Sphingobacterium sp. SGG-5]